MIATCINCASETDAAKYQDETYGPGRRVQTPTKTAGIFRCTCCGKTNEVKSQKETSTKK